MAVIRSFNQPTVESRPLPSTGLPNRSAPVEAFGNAQQTAGQARDLQVAGQFVDKAADSLERIALTEMRDMNETRVQELANGFISGQQFTLYTDKDAFYRKKGQDAINGAQSATDKLLELKKETIGLAANDYQRRRLGTMLDSQINEATNGISRHVAVQSQEWQKNVAEGRQTLLKSQTALDYNDYTKIEGYAAASEATAREQAKLAGLTGTDGEAAMVMKARSDIYTTAISQLLQNDQKRSALALYGRVKGKLDDKDNIKLASAMKSTATDVEADDWIMRSAPNQGRQEVRKFWEAKGYSPEAASVLAGNFQWESSNNPGAVNPKDGRDGSDSVGIGQWNADRAKALKKFAADNNVDWRDRRTQLEFAAHELETTEKATGEKLKGSKSLEDANSAAVGFFRPAGWTTRTPEAAHGYQGRLANARAAFNDTGVGFDKANTQGLVLAALNDPGISRETKVAITTKLTKESAALEASRASTIKGLRDVLEATLQTMPLAPDSYTKGTLGQIANGLEAAGEKSEAARVRILATFEDQLLSFATAPQSAQTEAIRTVAASLAPGPAGALLGSLNAINKKDSADTAKAAGDEFATIKTAVDNGIRAETLAPKATGLIEKYMRTGSPEKAREVLEWFNSQVTAQAINQAPPAEVATMIAGMRSKIEAGEQDNATIKQLDAMEDTRRKQEAEFKKDALATGSTVYSKDLGPLPPIADLPARAAYAKQISDRQGGLPVLPFTQPEIATMRNKLEQGTPESQAQTFAALSALPAESIPGVAAALAGTKDTGNMLSRSYAAALSFYAEKDPASRQVADQILGGARITKEMGDAGKKAPTGVQGWQTTLNDRIGNIFFDIKGMPAVIADAVASVYTYQMHKAGRQGETIDSTMLDQAITTVIGTPVTRNGQAFLPPIKGMDTYEVDRAVRSITDADLTGLRTTEGDAITADVLIRRGMLSNAGQDGVYFVRIPDPRAGMVPRPIVKQDGSAWRLDLRPFVEKSKTATPGYASDENAPTGLRRDLGRRYLPQPQPAP